MTNFEYIDFLPCVPEELITEALTTIDATNYWLNKKSDSYRVFPGTEKLYNFIHSHLNEQYRVTVQVISNTLPIHVDIGRSVVFNYIIDTGGDDIHTIFYSKNNEDYTIIESHNIKPFKWHRLNVATPHSVSTISPNNKRISLSVFMRDENNPFV
jgi:hypothetical protein